MHDTDTLYIKIGKKYKKIGTTMTHDVMWDGLWLIQTHEGSREFNNLAVRLCDLPQKAEVQKYMKAHLTKNAIIRAIQKLNMEKRLGLCSLSDYADEIIKEVYNDSMKEDFNEKSNIRH
jgi:hypothetical protein